MPSFAVEDMVVGITGGGGHLGRSVALGLAAAGAQVVICGRDADRLARVCEEASSGGLAGRVLSVQADVRDEADVERVLDFMQCEYGRVDAWVNNASGGQKQLLSEVDSSGVSRTLEQCLTQVMVTTRCVAERMIPQKRGSIVNVASMYGMVSPQPHMYSQHPEYHNPPAYGAAKAGVIQFTRYAACHLAPHGIRVNCISPGPFPNPQVQESERFVAELTRRVPLGRVGQGSEMVGPVLFLLSNAASYVTGHNLVVDGGWTAW